MKSRVHSLGRWAVATCVFLFLLTVLTPGVTPAPTPLGQLIEAIRREMQPEQAMNFMRHVYSTDRWFTFPKFQETAEYLKESMKGIGLEDVVMLGAPADGSSQSGFWTMPVAWDVKSARLESLRCFGGEQTDRMRRAIDHRAWELGLHAPVKPTAATDSLANRRPGSL